MGRPYRDLLALLSLRPAWIAFAVIALLTGVQAFVLADLTASVTRTRDPGRLGLFVLGFNLVYFPIHMALRFWLARQLGGEVGKTPPAAGSYVGYAFGYYLLFGLANTAFPLVFTRLGLPMVWYTLLQATFAIALNLALFPVAVRLAALAHSGNALRMRQVWDGMTPLWYVGMAGLTAATYALRMVPRPANAAGSSGLMVVSTLLSSLLLTMGLVYTVAAYRHLSEGRRDMASVFD